MKHRTFRNFAKSGNIRICIEMHKSTWNDEFRKWSCKDLCGEGSIYDNPDIIENLTDSQKDKIRRGSYNVYPHHASLIQEKGWGLMDYVYVSDDENGNMEIVYQTPVTESSPQSSKSAGKRFLKFFSENT